MGEAPMATTDEYETAEVITDSLQPAVTDT
jgi:hypothetical protein